MPRIFQRCAKTWCVAAVTAMKTVADTSDSSYEVIENNTIKRNEHNLHPTNIYEK
jgi:hypothetical protein